MSLVANRPTVVGVLALLALAPVSLSGCQASAPDAALHTRALLAAVPTASGKSSEQLSRQVKAPPGVPPRSLERRSGDALQRALMSLDQIIVDLPEPEFVARAATGPGPAEGDPPLAAQHAYVAGRLAWRQGDNAKATSALQIAARLAPRAPQIHQLLAKTNPIRAAYHLQRALALQPNDAPSAAALGGHLLEQRQWDEAIAVLVFARKQLADEPASIDHTLPMILRYHLGNALLRQSYDLAAIEQVTQFLEAQPVRGPRSRLWYQVIRAQQRAGRLWRAVGDAYHRLDQPAKALQAYTRAAEEPFVDARLIAGRRAFTLLRLARPNEARQVTMTYLRGIKPTASDLQLVTYLVRHGVPAAELAAELIPIYHDQSEPAQFAQLIADLLGEEQGKAFLVRNLAARPSDRAVFTQLLRQERGDPTAPLATAQAARLLLLTADAIDAAPEVGADFVARLFEVVPDRRSLLDAAAALPEPQRKRPALRFIKALALLDRGQSEAGRDELAYVVTHHRQLLAARMELARLLIASQEYDRAEGLLKELPNPNDLPAVLLRARLLAQTQRVSQALDLLDEASQRHGTRVDLILFKAELQTTSGAPIDAEQTLLRTLRIRPDAEPIYTALFDLYDRRLVSDVQSQTQRLMQRLLRALPNSRLARLRLAVLYLFGPREDTKAAERLVRLVLDEHPADIEALAILNIVLRKGGRLDDPFEGDTLELIDRALAQPRADAAELANLLANVLKSVKDTGRIDAVFQERLKRFPQHEADLMFAWATACDQRDQRQRAESIMVELVKKYPKHALANNYLAYLWAWRGVNLKRALILVQSALDTDPDNAMYLDSIGWVYYKLGEFEQAARWLKKAENAERGQNAIILDHVGDAVYRLGRRREAVRYWDRSKSRTRPDDATSTDPERRTLADRLQAKISAVAARVQVVPVAEVPDQAPSEP